MDMNISISFSNENIFENPIFFICVLYDLRRDPPVFQRLFA